MARLFMLNTDRVRFESHIKRNGECWEWTGAPTGKGQFQFRLDGQWLSARRLCYEAYLKLLEKGDFVHVDCGNPNCIRPKHMRVSKSCRY